MWKPSVNRKLHERPPTERVDKLITLYASTLAKLTAMADRNKRSVAAEAEAAIEKHVHGYR